MFVQDVTGIDPATHRPVTTRRMLPFSIAEHTPAWKPSPSPNAPSSWPSSQRRTGNSPPPSKYVSLMPTPDEATTLDLIDGTPILETTRITSAGGRPVLVETECTSGDGIQHGYRLS